jgi:hypothetical protein
LTRSRLTPCGLNWRCVQRHVRRTGHRGSGRAVTARHTNSTGRRVGVATRWTIVGGGLFLTLAACGHRPPRGMALTVVRDTSALATAASVVDTTPITIGDFQFRGSNSGLRSRWPPVMVQVNVTVTNISQHAATLNLLGGNCEVLVRIYRHRIPSGRPVFDASMVGIECYVPLRHIVLAAGHSVTLHSAGDGPGIELPPGRYDLTGIVTVVNPATAVAGATVNQRVEVPAGSIRVPQPYE